MSAPSSREIKAHAREALEARVRARVALLREAFTRELTPHPDDAIFFDIHTHRLTRAQGTLELRLVRTPEEDARLRAGHDIVRETDRGMPLAHALDLLAAEAEAIVAHTVAAIWTRVHSPLVPGALRAAVLGRADLVRRWPWDEDHEASAVLAGLVCCLGAALANRGAVTPPGGEPQPYGWPADVAPRAVADWAEPILKDERESLARFRAESEAGAWGRIAAPWRALAVLSATLHAVERDRQRQAMAIDAGRLHHDLLMGLRDLPKDTRTPYRAPTIDHRIELLAPGRCVQLTLDLDPEGGTMSEALVRALRETRGWKGLRHWAALQKLLLVDGGRAGWVRWTLDGHLDAIGTRVKNRTKATLRADVARQVEAFTRFELAAYAADGTLRERRPLLLVGAKYDRLQGSEWKLDGMQLTINSLLYQGVRESGGRLGRNWHPAPVELAQVDDKHHPYTLALGLILPIRWRLAHDEGKDHITIKGANALALAGIPYRARKPGAAWKALERDLAELQRIGGLGRWEWAPPETTRTLEGRLHLWPAPWMQDRMIHDVRPRELPPGPAVLTGAELKAWRTRRGLTQGQAAEKLHVSRPTIARAEARPLEPLTPALTGRMRAAGA